MATPEKAPTGLRHMDARMVKGLPDPQSAEGLEWLREALAALQRADPRADVDLGGIESRLALIEARLASLEGKPDADLSGIWDALAALRKLIEALQPAQMVLPEIPAPVIITRDPLDPASWDSLEAAKAGLEVLVTREAARRCGHEVTLYEEMCRLDALGKRRTDDQNLQLMQHQGWAKERQAVELARLEHNQRIRKLGVLADALGYDWRANWPEVAS